MARKSASSAPPRGRHETVVRDMLRMLWTHRLLVAAALGFALAAEAAALVLLPPRYTGEAMIQLDFVRDETVAGQKVQSTASVDAVAVVISAVRVIRSRATASAVVSMLGLDKDPFYTRPLLPALPARALASVRGIFGLPEPTPHDVAVARLMKQITVTNDARSYLITVSVTTPDPALAARLANWIASEYLRGRLREQANEAYAVAEREMTALSSVFGPRHPSYVAGLAKLGRLKAELAAVQEGAVVGDRQAVVAREMVRFAAGQSLLPAEAIMTPSGHNVALITALTVLAALALGMLLAWLAERGLLRWSVPAPAVGQVWSPAPAVAPAADRRLEFWDQ